MKGKLILKRYDLLTPEGTRDLLFEECAAKREITERLTRLFGSYGYSEVMTPGLEFFDVFDGKTRYFPQETMYKLVDGKNRLMVLRPDNTMPIARLAATRLKDEELPLKLFYNQSVFMVNPKNRGRDDEFTQSGIEILGGESPAADYEALALAAKALAVCDEDFRLEIGDSGIFTELLELLGASEDEGETIRSLIRAKNYPALNERLGNSKAAEALKKLPALFGGGDVFDAAEKYMLDERLKEKLSKLKEVFENLDKTVGGGRICVDLGLVHKRNYYTGILFRGYVEGYGQPALSGGRYDALLGDFGRNAKAVGFAVNVEAAAKVALRKRRIKPKAPDAIVHGGAGNEMNALSLCERLTREGLTVYNSLFKDISETETYARKHGISKIFELTDAGAVERQV